MHRLSAEMYPHTRALKKHERRGASRGRTGKIPSKKRAGGARRHVQGLARSFCAIVAGASSRQRDDVLLVPVVVEPRRFGDAELGLCVNAVCSMFCGLAPCGGYGYGTGPSGVAEAGAARGAIGEAALAWLRLLLQGDEGARPWLLERPGIASGFESKGVRPEDMERL